MEQAWSLPRQIKPLVRELHRIFAIEIEYFISIFNGLVFPLCPDSDRRRGNAAKAAKCH